MKKKKPVNKIKKKTKAFFVQVFVCSILCFSLFPVLAEETSILVDIEPPQINIIKPVEGEEIITEFPLLEVKLIDQESGISEEKIIITIDGIDVTGDIEIEREDTENIGPARIWQVRYQPSIPLNPGEHRVQIDVEDNAGNTRRKQWCFFVQVEKGETGWDLDLNNKLSYSYLPLEKLKNISTLNTNYRYKDQLLLFRFQTSATDHPGLVLEPNLGEYYLHLDNFTLGWQNKEYGLQYGNINLPFDSGLLHFALGFKGICVDKVNPDEKWKLFQGITASSIGLGLSVMNTYGGIYQWRKGTGTKQVYFLDIGKQSSTKLLGFQDRFVFSQGLVNYELSYGQDSYGEGGGGLRLQGGTSIFDILLDTDFLYFQSSYPLTDIATISSARGGAYKYSISGHKNLKDEKKLICNYSRQENNLESRERISTKRQSVQIDYSGLFSPDFKWFLGYQGGIVDSYDKSKQQIFKFGFNREYEQGSLRNNFLFTGNTFMNRGDTRSFQYSSAYNRVFPQLDIETNSILQYTIIDKTEKKEDKLELRISADKTWFSELLKSRIVFSYKTNREKNDILWTSGRDILDLETYLNIRVNENNSLKLNAGVSFWEKESSGRDYKFSLSWQSKIL